MVHYLTASLILAASSYIYPLPSWQVSTQHGEEIGDELYHMGVDAGFDLPTAAPVYAAADGIVREVQERSQFGLVVLIEHEPDTAAARVSLYGHLDPTDVRVAIGQVVQAGDVIGVLGDETNNGGWPTHLHFGIHKAPYTGEWVYYGHVYDPDTAKLWYDPEKFIPNHLATDVWQPSLATDLVADSVVGNTLTFTVTAGDIGGGVERLTVQTKTAASAWVTATTIDQPAYTTSVAVDISSYPDGAVFVKLIARDAVTEKVTLKRTVQKDPYRYTTPAFVTSQAGQSNALITQWSYGGTALNTFLPFSANWSAGGYIALADQVVTAVRRHTKSSTALVKRFTEAGELLNSFKLPLVSPQAITTTADTIMIEDQESQAITGYSITGEPRWTIAPPFPITDVAMVNNTLYLCGYNQAGKTKVVVMDTAGVVLQQFRPFSKTAGTRGCHLAVGDLIVVGSRGKMPGTVTAFSLAGERLVPAFQPFGAAFTGQVDVAVTQWDTPEDAVTEAEILVSQASAGQAWVKAYRLLPEPTVLFEKLVYEAAFTNGAQVVSSTYDQ